MSTFSRTAASTNGNDVINGTTGNDTLKGLDGNDRLFGDRGRDRLLGGDGNDTLIGGGGNDYFKGGRGSDTADYSDQSVDMRIHLGSEFARFINRSWADETLKSIENIVAGSGNDDITGNDDSNLLQGGDGDDYLNGGKGKDTLEGGAGNDTLDGGGGTDLLDGGEGFDIADYSGLTSDVDVDLEAHYGEEGGSIIFLGKSWKPETLISIEGIWTGSGDDRIDGGWSNWSGVTINSGAGNDTVLGGQGDDHLLGGDGDDVFYGVRGSDTLIGGDGNDTFEYDYGGNDIIDGGQGVDSAEFSLLYSHDYFDSYYYEKEYRLTAGINVDLSKSEKNVKYMGLSNLQSLEEAFETIISIENVKTDEGNDHINGSDAKNILRSGYGNDTLFGGKGRDKLYGGGDDDVLHGGGGTDTLYGGEGTDVADYSDSTTDIFLDLETQTTEFPNTSWKTEKLVSIEGAFTGSGNDTIQGNQEDNIFDAGLGEDRIIGSGGHDTVIFASHEEGLEINLGKGFAMEAYSGAMDKLKSIENVIGGCGDDFIRGDKSTNRLDGGDGSDNIRGMAGDDLLVLSRGEDTIAGGSGHDILIVDFKNEFDAQTTVYEAVGDRFYDYTVTSELDIELDVDLELGMATFTLDGEHTTTFKGVEKLVGSTGSDTISGTSDSDEIWALGGANRVQGRGGDDVIIGGGIVWDDADSEIYFDADSTFYSSDSEALYGGRGEDTIYGSGTLDGGNGDDKLYSVSWFGTEMYGGKGADQFIFDSRPGYYDNYFGTPYSMKGTVADFDSSQGDRIVISLPEAYLDYDDAEITFVGNESDVGYGEYGFFKDGDDTVIHFNTYDDWYYDRLNATVAIRLTDYTGELTENDILFV